jgi:IS30 family transposase
MKNYNQLNLNQRYQIQALLETEISKSEIAEVLGVLLCTIYREHSRNIAKRGSTAGNYIASNVQRLTDSRHKNKAKQVFFTKPLKGRIAGLLRYEKCSPELISKCLELDG